MTDTSTWQTLGGGVADYLSALPLPLHHLLKYSAPATSMSEAKREEQPAIVSVTANALPSICSLTSVSFFLFVYYRDSKLDCSAQ